MITHRYTVLSCETQIVVEELHDCVYKPLRKAAIKVASKFTAAKIKAKWSSAKKSIRKLVPKKSSKQPAEEISVENTCLELVLADQPIIEITPTEQACDETMPVQTVEIAKPSRLTTVVKSLSGKITNQFRHVKEIFIENIDKFSATKITSPSSSQRNVVNEKTAFLASRISILKTHRYFFLALALKAIFRFGKPEYLDNLCKSSCLLPLQPKPDEHCMVRYASPVTYLLRGALKQYGPEILKANRKDVKTLARLKAELRQIVAFIRALKSPVVDVIPLESELTLKQSISKTVELEHLSVDSRTLLRPRANSLPMHVLFEKKEPLVTFRAKESLF